MPMTMVRWIFCGLLGSGLTYPDALGGGRPDGPEAIASLPSRTLPKGHGAGKYLGSGPRQRFGTSDFEFLINTAFTDRERCDYSPSVAPYAVKRYGVGSVDRIWRFEVRPGDLACVDLNVGGVQLSKSRSELSQPPGELRFGLTYWGSWSFRLEAGSRAPSKGQGVIVGQYHGGRNRAGTAQSPSPIANFQVNGDGTLSFQTLSSQGPRDGYDEVVVLRHYRSSTPLMQGRCYSVVHEINFDWRRHGTGFVKVWLDGKKIVSYAGPIGNNDQEGPYRRIGAYSAQNDTRFAIQYENYEFGRRNLSSRITHPKACV